METTELRVLDAKWRGRDAFTLEEVAVILGISRWMAYQSASRKELPTIRLGRRLIVPRIALERMLAG